MIKTLDISSIQPVYTVHRYHSHTPWDNLAFHNNISWHKVHQDNEREFAKREGELVAQVAALGAEADKSKNAEKEAQTQVNKTD